jgi:hypothetical protein
MTEPKKDAPKAAEPKKAAAAEDSGEDLLAAAKVKAPNLSADFVAKYNLDDEYLRKVARGEEPPPPYNGPDFSATDLHYTDGGWQSTAAGVAPEDVGKDAIKRDA